MDTIPKEAKNILSLIPKDFIDDGCSKAPDSWFGFNFRWACRIHDWRYCTRCHPPEVMHYTYKVNADRELRKFIRMTLPFGIRHTIAWVYYAAVWRYGGIGAFDSCGPKAGERCRHNIRMRK